MNKLNKKLSLSRNTIKTLAHETLDQAAGGLNLNPSRLCSQPCTKQINGCGPGSGEDCPI
jgi:hypothetical protein